ncbi:Rhodanese-like domain-containing protein 4, chloroplastic [Morella rubra]|uniref:Rhodanese-like domain-containing protein 4, chloroplastic n=1 Tax=Morella rubra TaxID=262757 RepID=A0A6A1W7D0_9ROSI|nr:Rhodanese-like domain-containing protein 4, chloroplastic [Morella rubra]
MEALNAACSSPLSVLCDRKKELRKISSLPITSPLKFSNSPTFSPIPSTLKEFLPRSFQGGLVLLSSVLNTGLARSLSYEEALQQSVNTSTATEFDANGVLDSVLSFGTENPALIAAGAAILVVPLVLSQVLNKPKPWGVESAKNAYAKLGDDANSQLLDIRAPMEFRQVGSPDIRNLRKRPLSIAYKGKDKPGFLKKLSLKFKEPENTTLFILDKFDGSSELVAELVTVNGFKAAYAIKDGAEGPRGWMNSGLPWIPPRKAFSLDLSNLTDAISGAVGEYFSVELNNKYWTFKIFYVVHSNPGNIRSFSIAAILQEGSDAVTLTLGIAAAAGFGVLAFSEIETILQVLGSAALIQFVSKKLLFAEARKKTLQEVDEFLNTKVAPKELVDEIKQIGKALLPSPVTSKALPTPVEVSPEPATAVNAVQKIEAALESKVETTGQTTPEINSVPKTEVKAESPPGFSQSLSPYPLEA